MAKLQLRAAFSHGDVFASLFANYLCSGDCIEDVMDIKPFWDGRDVIRVCSSDVILRTLRRLSVDNIAYVSKSGKKGKKCASEGIFGPQYIYCCVITDDWENSEQDIIIYCNKRGASERNFVCQNNDFGWARLPLFIPQREQRLPHLHGHTQELLPASARHH